MWNIFMASDATIDSQTAKVGHLFWFHDFSVDFFPSFPADKSVSLAHSVMWLVLI